MKKKRETQMRIGEKEVECGENLRVVDLCWVKIEKEENEEGVTNRGRRGK